MNREIKFRVWDNVDYMSTPFTLIDIQEKKIEFTSDCVVMQFTGMLDRNGNEIYEGDIIAHKFYNTPVVVEYKGCGFEFGDVSPYSNSIEIIGNIYENPELLNIKP